VPDNPADPLAGVIRELRAGQCAGLGAGAGRYRRGRSAGPGPGRTARQLAKTGAGKQLATLPFGADKWGHDIVKKTIKGGQTSIVVGLVAACWRPCSARCSARWPASTAAVDDLFNWFYSIFTSIPSILMILTVAAVLQKKGVTDHRADPGPDRLDRPVPPDPRRVHEAQGARIRDGGRRHRRVELRKMFSHIFPNVSHVALVQMSILVVGFIKSEVILSFLGFGVPVGVVSWGSMLNEAQNELILGKWWQLVAASVRDGHAGDGVLAVYRRAARCARPETEVRPAMTTKKCHAEVRDLRVKFRIDKQNSLRGGEGHLLRACRECDRGPGRRIGQRQVGQFAGRDGPAAGRDDDHPRVQSIRFDGRELLAVDRRARASCAARTSR
jgi:peptide/nickel transport system permease protein